jgi:ribosomal protein S18 acetylase RimI-like enzyme
MEVQILHDKSVISAFLNKSAEHQIYCIGDLDDFFWPKTIWYALIDNDDIQSIALLYTGMEIPTLLLFYDMNPDYSVRLLELIKTFLPNRFFAHFGEGLIDVFGKHNMLAYYGLNYKMILKKTPIEIIDTHIQRLFVNDLPEIQDFYSIAYPNNWFDKRMLETEKYFGYFIDNRLVGISGIHVYSSEYKVAALGNIATHPDYRGHEIAYKLTSALCYDLSKSVDFIGLNVRSNNGWAVKCYQKVGFEIIGKYDECFIENIYK